MHPRPDNAARLAMVRVILLALLAAGFPMVVALLLAVSQSWQPVIPLLVGTVIGVLLIVLAGPLLLISAQLPAAPVSKRWELEGDRLKLQNDVRAILIQAVGGLALLGGLYFTWLQLQNTQEQLNRQFRLTQRGQVAERYTRAIDQLGSEKRDIRLGGIYGLEQIAKEVEEARDDDPQADRVRLVAYDVLAAYVREHAAGNPPTGASPDRGPGVGSLQTRAPDVQAAMAVLARRNVRDRPPDPQLDLSAVDLRGARLANAHLNQVDLHDARLDHADLQDAQLNNAILSAASLAAANLRKAVLVKAQLSNAQLTAAHLSDGLLRDANLHGADLRKAELCGANLERADLSDADLVDAIADGGTTWPTPGFDWRSRGVQLATPTTPPGACRAS